MNKGVNNSDAINDGWRVFDALKRNQMLDALTHTAYSLLVHAETSKEFHNLTGNTLTSYMVGIYENGKLIRVVSMYDADSVEKPTSRKLSRGNGVGVIRVEDYDSGRFIAVKKYSLVNTDEGYGYDTSKRFLAGYAPNMRKGYGFVMCTGTEYSEYLENSKRLNVLTETFTSSSKSFMSNLKPI